MPATICSNVLLPDPFSPTMQKVSPRMDFEIDIAERPKIAVERNTIETREFFQTRARRGIDGIALGYTPKLDDR